MSNTNTTLSPTTSPAPEMTTAQAIYTVRLYDGRQCPATRAYRVDSASTMREARRIAARMLGHSTLRGASTWDRYQGGTVYQFGPKVEENGHDFVVIEEGSVTP